MRERIVKYCSKCGYELRETTHVEAVSYFRSDFKCPDCRNEDAMSLLWVDRRNVYTTGEKL